MSETPMARAVDGLVEAAGECVSSVGAHARGVAAGLDDPDSYTADQAAADLAGGSLRALACGAKALLAGLNVITELSEPPILFAEDTVQLGGPRPARLRVDGGLVDVDFGDPVSTDEIVLVPERLDVGERDVVVRVFPAQATGAYKLTIAVEPEGGGPPVPLEVELRL